MVCKHDDTSIKNPAEGVVLRVLSRGGKLMMTEVTFEKGAVGAIHRHEHEQITYIAEGNFEFVVDGSVHILSVGDSCYIEANSEHGVLALTSGKLLDVFSPQREDFLD